MPLLILNGFEYVLRWGAIPMQCLCVQIPANRSEPAGCDRSDRLSEQRRFGAVMENVMSNLKEESASGFVRLWMPQACQWH